MDNFTTQFTASVAITCIGYLLKQRGYFSKNDSEVLAKLIMNFTIPASAIYNISQVTLNIEFGSIIFISLFHNILLLLIGFIVFRKKNHTVKGSLLLLVPGLSLSSFTLPLLEGLHDPTALSQVAMLDIGNAPVSLVGVYILAYYYSNPDVSLDSKALAKSVLHTIPILTYLIAVLLNIFQFQYPPFILSLASNIAKANMPCSFFMLGIALEFHFQQQELLDLGKLLLLRYFCGICAGLVLAFLLQAESITRFVITAGLIAPLPLSAIAYTKQFHYKAEFAAVFANATVLFSFLFTLLLYKLLL